MAKLPTIAEVRKMSAEDLRSEVATIRRQAAEVRLGVELSKEKDTSKMKKLRKHLAQLLTVLQEKGRDATALRLYTDASAQTPKKSLAKRVKTPKISARA